MSEQTANVKPLHHKMLCATCGQPLPRNKVRSVRAIMARKILTALEKGPATGAEIQERMGVRNNEVFALLRMMERRGEIRCLGKTRRPEKSRGRAAFPNLWALVEVKP